MIRKVIKVPGIIVLLPVVAFALLVADTVHANTAAERAARAFCARITVGSDIDAVLARTCPYLPVLSFSRQDRDLKRVIIAKDEHRFMYQGGIFYAGVCRVRVANGRVASSHVLAEGD